MRAQAHTLEGIVAALLVLSSVVIALQVTAVTPLTASTASQHIEMQERASAAGVLSAARSDDQIRPTLLYWNESGARFHGAGTNGYYTTGGPPTVFGDRLDEAFGDQGYAFNVVARYVRADGNIRERRVVYMGRPSDSAASSSATVTLYDSDRLRDATGNETEETVATNPFFVDDIDEQSNVYAVVEVEVIVWRM